MGNLAKRHSIAEMEESTALRTLEVNGLLSRLRRLRQQIAAIRRDAHEPSLPLDQLAAVALRAEVIAEAAVIKLAEMTRLSQHDLLTDLPNRVLMLDRLDNALAMAHRRRSHFAVLFVDLDGFKDINDTKGHCVGDRALQLAARRLTSTLRASDTVSRHGGDEFLVLIPEASQASAAMIADKLLTALSVPAQIDGQPIQLSASIGIAVYPEDGKDAETLIHCADQAMYRAKEKGPGRFEFSTARVRAAGSEDPVAHGNKGHSGIRRVS